MDRQARGWLRAHLLQVGIAAHWLCCRHFCHCQIDPRLNIALSSVSWQGVARRTKLELVILRGGWMTEGLDDAVARSDWLGGSWGSYPLEDILPMSDQWSDCLDC